MKRIVRLLILLALAGGAGYYIWLHRRPQPLILTGSVTDAVSTTKNTRRTKATKPSLPLPVPGV